MRTPRLGWLVPLAGLAAMLLDSSATQADTPTCTLSGLPLLQAYSKAIANGYRFQCAESLKTRTDSDVWSRILSGNQRMPVLALPSGELLCTSKTSQNNGKITGGLFANKDPASGRTHLTALRNGWTLVDFKPDGARSFGGFTVPTFKVGVVRYEVATPSAGKSYAFNVSQIRIKKPGGDCSKAVDEAFGPELGASTDTVCAVNIGQAHAKAIQKGYSFDCWDNGGNPAHVPPLNMVQSLHCIGTTHSQYGLATFFFRNSQSGISSMKNGWRLLSYKVSGASSFGGYWERDQGLISFNVEMKQNSNYSIQVSDLKLAKNGGNCGKALDEAFGP